MNNNPNGESILTLPLLVARSLVVFPSMSEDIEVGREFSLKAVEQARSATNNLLFVVSQKGESTDSPTIDDIYSAGTLCRVTSYTPYDGACASASSAASVSNSTR